MEEHRLALAPGYQIEHFRIESVLGKGGFGITYLAIDLQLGKRVAIKELLPDSIATRVDGSTVVPHSPSLRENWDWARERFLDEARVLAGFSHPAIVGVHRLLEANGTVYMVMDYVDGESYESRLRRIFNEPSQASLMALIGPILDGLQDVHAKGLLHRDIKPENILINQRGQPVLIDFGAARSSLGATMTMTSIVTHGYSPAEQYQTKGRMGPWTDIYALGAMMCRAITGEKPPVASDRIMDDDFEWLAYRQIPGFSTPFLQAVDWALCVRPEERPAHIADWIPTLIALNSVVAPNPATGDPPPSVEERGEIHPSAPPPTPDFGPRACADEPDFTGVAPGAIQRKSGLHNVGRAVSASDIALTILGVIACCTPVFLINSDHGKVPLAMLSWQLAAYVSFNAWHFFQRKFLLTLINAITVALLMCVLVHPAFRNDTLIMWSVLAFLCAILAAVFKRTHS